MPPQIQAFDHVHVFVANRAQAEVWYRDVLGLYRTKELEFWAEDGGPLTIQNASGSVHLALFERSAQPCRSVIALRVGASEYLAFRAHLRSSLAGPVTEEDHVASVSMYFRDPDGNPYELTTYEVSEVRGQAPSDA